MTEGCSPTPTVLLLMASSCPPWCLDGPPLGATWFFSEIAEAWRRPFGMVQCQQLGDSSSKMLLTGIAALLTHFAGQTGVLPEWSLNGVAPTGWRLSPRPPCGANVGQ